jgi:two-component system chemotaxis response regulator CheY
MKLVKLKILIVDNSSTIRKLYNKVLPSIFENEITVYEAENGVDALDALDKYNGIDIIFTELEMPNMGGLELIQRVRDIHYYNHIKVFVANANIDKPLLAKLKSLKANGYIKKPLNDKKMIRRIKSEVESIPGVKITEKIKQEEIKIMVVDDSKTARKLVKLEVEGVLDESIVFIEAEDGVEALKLLEEASDIELMFLDINMPNMKGDEVLNKLKVDKKYPNIKVVMVTTESDMGLVKRCIVNGANGYIVKPLDTKKMYNSLKKVYYNDDSVKIRDEKDIK